MFVVLEFVTYAASVNVAGQVLGSSERHERGDNSDSLHFGGNMWRCGLR